MEEVVINVQSITPATRKDGSFVKGVGKNNQPWQLFKINEKYSYFNFEAGFPKFKGDTTFNLEITESGRYTNYLLSLPKKGTKETPLKDYDQGEMIINGLGLIRGDIKKLKDELGFLKDAMENLSNTLKRFDNEDKVIFYPKNDTK